MDIDQRIKLAIGEAVVRAAVNEQRVIEVETRAAHLEKELAALRAQKPGRGTKRSS